LPVHIYRKPVGKKGLILFLLLLVAGLLALVLSIWNSRRNSSADPFNAIPERSYLVIESSDLPGLLNSFTEGNGFFAELGKIQELERFTGSVLFLRDFINRPELTALFEKNTALISFGPDENGNGVPMIVMNLPSAAGLRSIMKAAEDLKGTDLHETKINRLKISSVIYEAGPGRDTLYFSYGSGLLICSSSLQMILETPGRLGTEVNIKSVGGFSKIRSSAGKNENKIYLVFGNLKAVLPGLTAEGGIAFAESLEQLASCSDGDVFINENGFVFSGYTESTLLRESLYKFKSGAADELKSADILPSSTVLFETVRLPAPLKLSVKQAAMDDSAFSLAEKLSPFTGSEITRAMIELKSDSGKLSTVSVIELSNRSMAEQVIILHCTNDSTAGSSGNNEKVIYFNPDDLSKIPVYITGCSNLSAAWFPGFMSEVKDSLIAFADNYMITADSYQALTRFLYDNILKKTLSNDPAYRDFESTLPSRAVYYFYCVPGSVYSLLQGLISDSLFRIVSENKELINKMQPAGFKMAPGNGMIFNTLSIRYGGDVRMESGAEWETLLDTAAAIKPFFFTNHNSGAKEIFIQDYRNNAYLINAAGRILWKVRLDERIRGQVFMIDFYGNGKYQLLFAGRNYLHLLDRNGNYVERYPVKFRSTASGPPALFDYENNGQYRILVPGDDKLIYAYDKEGNVVKGWRPFRTEDAVKDEIKFFRVSGKDYLVAADSRNVYFLDRTGNIRVKLNEPVTKARGSEIRLSAGRESGIVFTSPDGTIQQVSFDGTIRKTRIRTFSTDHMFDFFDMDGDGFGEFIFIDAGILYLYDNDKSEIFGRNFNTDMLKGPICFVFSGSDRKIGVTDNNKKQIYLVDKNGDIVRGFPLRGASMFSIGKISSESSYHLIVGGDDNFLYNYRLGLD
jgi:hypothetical protein